MTDAHFSPAVIILGAGRSTRMGRPKLLLSWGKTSVVGHLINEWRTLGANQVAVVHAAEDQSLLAELDRVGFPAKERIANPGADSGMFSSIVCAARWPGWQASLTHWAIVLGDQPHLRRHTLEQLVDFVGQHPEQVCQPTRNGKLCHPVVVPKAVFLKLAESRLGNLREFLHDCRVAGCEIADPGLDLDIDRPEDYQQARMMSGLTTQP